MKLWRRIVGSPRFSSSCYSDLEVRARLHVPSIDCLIRRNRLKYLGRLLRSDVRSLLAMLSVRDARGQRLAWAETIVGDLRILKAALPQIFESVSDPDDSSSIFQNIAKLYPLEWDAILRRYCEYRDDVDVVSDKFVDNSATSLKRKCVEVGVAFVCRLCPDGSAVFSTSKQLEAHNRAKHRQRTAVAHFLGASTICPACGTDFHSRARLLNHASDGRIRSKARTVSCRDQILSMGMEPIRDSELCRLNAQAKSDRQLARKAGHTQIIALKPAVRARPSHLMNTSCDCDGESSQVRPRKRLRTKTPCSEIACR